MKPVAVTIALVVLMMGSSPGPAWAAADTAVSGVVRDGHGTPQMGALIELLGPDASVLARAFTDDRGRYVLGSVLPGSYRLRASAAFLLPVVRDNLRVRAGMRAVADLTMTAIFETASWLPTERRSNTGLADDWQWTLRSTANRPLLRLAEGEDASSSVEASSSAEHPARALSQGQMAFLAGDGSFGEGAARQVLTMDRSEADGAVAVFRASIASGVVPSAEPSFTLASGMERQRPLGGNTRLFVSVASHPELQTGSGGGVEELRAASTEKIALGDAVMVDAGTLFTAERLLGTAFRSAPYLRVAFRPAAGFTLEYRFATDRGLQRTEDLDSALLPEEVLADSLGRPLLPRAQHQEMVATMADPKRSMSVAVYRESLPIVSLQGGGGGLSERAIKGVPAITDPTTGTLRVAMNGFTDTGVRAAWSQELSPEVSLCVQTELGQMLMARRLALTSEDLAKGIDSHFGAAVSGSLRLQNRHSGSRVEVRYRWQPKASLTQIDSFDADPGDAFLGLSFRQRLWSGRRLKGVNAVMEATNLLAEGYQPILGPDGQTLFLAQVPRSMLGGLAFSF